MKTQSPSRMPQAAAVPGLMVTRGKGCRRRRERICRLLERKKGMVRLPVVRIRGYSRARSGRETGVSGGSSQQGRGSAPARSSTVDHSSNFPVGV